MLRGRHSAFRECEHQGWAAGTAPIVAHPIAVPAAARQPAAATGDLRRPRRGQLPSLQQHPRQPRPSVVVAGTGPAPPQLAAGPDAPKAKLAVFVSGGGSNFRAIHAACMDGRINAEVVVRDSMVICGLVTWQGT
jgi:phosphoribosylglycinamide formyltransferase